MHNYIHAEKNAIFGSVLFEGYHLFARAFVCERLCVRVRFEGYDPLGTI